MSWDELVAAALIGTDRRPVGATGLPGLDERLAARAPEDRLLAGAAAWTVARRAGARAGAPVVVAAAEPEARTLCSADAAVRLASLLYDGELAELVPEWLERVAAQGLRPPPELVPALLDHAAADPALHRAAGQAAGPLGAWLADREPRWAFVRGATDDVERVWADGARAERRALLERLRRSDPEAARELVAGTFNDETWEDREAFVAALGYGLTQADEPFLEAALDDGRKPVRAAAAELLARLPGSRLAARVAARLQPLFVVADGWIKVALPGPPDAAEQRDGFLPGGRRAERLTAMLAAAPLGEDPSLVTLPVVDDLAPVVHEGWAEAAKRQGNAAWARALWPVMDDPELLTVLPRAEAEAAADSLVAARELEGQWGLELSKRVIAEIKQRRERGERGPDVRFAGHRIHPGLEAEAEQLRDLGGRDVWALCDILVTRAAMLRELG